VAAAWPERPNERRGGLPGIGLLRPTGESSGRQPGGDRENHNSRDPASTSHRTEPTPGCGALLAAFVELPVEPVDQLGHRLEPVGDHAQAVLAEVLRLDLERLCERDHDVI
jgi:hypothetical protein